jgi:hypothetical protein
MWLEAAIAYKINTELVKINLISDKERISLLLLLLLQLMEVNNDRILESMYMHPFRPWRKKNIGSRP